MARDLDEAEREELPDPKTAGREYRVKGTVHAVKMTRDFAIPSAGPRELDRGKAGDYLCEADGEIYVERGAAFERIYEPTHARAL